GVAHHVHGFDGGDAHWLPLSRYPGRASQSCQSMEECPAFNSGPRRAFARANCSGWNGERCVDLCKVSESLASTETCHAADVHSTCGRIRRRLLSQCGTRKPDRQLLLSEPRGGGNRPLDP